MSNIWNNTPQPWEIALDARNARTRVNKETIANPHATAEQKMAAHKAISAETSTFWKETWALMFPPKVAVPPKVAAPPAKPVAHAPLPASSLCFRPKL